MQKLGIKNSVVTPYVRMWRMILIADGVEIFWQNKLLRAVITDNIIIIIDLITSPSNVEIYLYYNICTSWRWRGIKKGTAQWFRLASSARIFINLCWYYITNNTTLK